MSIKELLEKIGVTENLDSAEKEVKSFLDGAYVPKSRFNEVNEEKNTLKNTVADRDKQLEDLKKASGDAEGLKNQIAQLQADNKKAKEEAEAKLKDLQFSNAIKLAIVETAQDVDIVSGLFDKTKLILGADGKVTGLDEQLKALEKDKPFLFKQQNDRPPYNPNAGQNGGSKNPFAKDSWNLTEQGKLFMSNPEQARSMAAAAGVKI